MRLPGLGLLALLAAGSGALAGDPAPAVDPKLSVLAPFVVKDEAICSFGFSFTCLGNPETKQIYKLLITDVQQGSLAESAGLVPGVEILRADGIKVADMKGGLGRNGDLMRLFVNRRYGDKITLVVLIKNSGYKVTLPARPAHRSSAP